MSRRSEGRPQLALPLSASLLLHIALGVSLLFVRTSSEPILPQSVSVRLIAASTGPREIGIVTQTPPRAAPPPTQSAAPQRSSSQVVKTPPKVAPQPKIDPTKSTTITESKLAKAATNAKNSDASTKSSVPTRAGGGDQGNTGTDVTTATFVGLDFPDQGYLQNIINRIMYRFRGPRNLPLVADFEFEILRNGCIQNLKVLRRSPNSAFNGSAQTAIEQAGDGCGFQQLPAAWKDDVLKIHFRFDPRIIGK